MNNNENEKVKKIFEIIINKAFQSTMVIENGIKARFYTYNISDENWNKFDELAYILKSEYGFKEVFFDIEGFELKPDGNSHILLTALYEDKGEK